MASIQPGENLPWIAGLPISVRWLARALGIALALVGWYAVASVFPNELMPFPIETLELTWGLVESGVLWPHLAATMWRILWGFIGSVILGLIFGIAMGTSDYWEQFATPYILIGLSVPAIAWAAISTLIFGFSELTPIVATVVTTFPFLAINIWKGVENIDMELVEMSRSFGVSNSSILIYLILPNTAGSLFTATRYGLAISWKIVTIAEIFASSNGIGYKLIQTYERYQFEQAWAWAVVFMIIILAIEYGVFKPLERRVFAYRQDADLSRVG